MTLGQLDVCGAGCLGDNHTVLNIAIARSYLCLRVIDGTCSVSSFSNQRYKYNRFSWKCTFHNLNSAFIAVVI